MTEFDKFSEDYEKVLSECISLSGFSPSYFDEYKIKEVYDFAKSKGIENKEIKILNFGCGIGKSERFIKKYFTNAMIYSVDVSSKSVEAAEERNSGLDNVTFKVFDGDRIPFEYEFDIILVANVFHHILPERHLNVLRHIREKLTKDGYLFIFEHNPLNPFTVKTVRKCGFDIGAILLNPVYTGKILSESGFKWRKIRFIIFFPRFLRFLLPLERYLRKVPLGAQYYFIVEK